MKRTVVIILLITLCAGIAGAEGMHLEARCAYSGSLGVGSILSFDAYVQEGKILAVSTLFPDYVLEAAAEESLLLSGCPDQTLLVSPDRAAARLQELEDLFVRWLDLQGGEYRKGVYAGDLFDKAETRCSCAFRLDDLIAFIRARSDGLLPEGPGFPEVMLKVSAFDENRFLSAQVCRGDDTVMTVSADLSVGTLRRFLFTWVEGERTYFRDISIQAADNRLEITCMFRAGSGTSLRTTEGTPPLFEEKLTVTRDTDNTSSFRMIFSSPALSLPLTASGQYETAEGGAHLSAEAFIEGRESEKLLMDVILEGLVRPVSFEDKKTIHTDSETESALISIPIMSGLTTLAGELIQALPKDYQQVLLTLIFQ